MQITTLALIMHSSFALEDCHMITISILLLLVLSCRPTGPDAAPSIIIATPDGMEAAPSTSE